MDNSIIKNIGQIFTEVAHLIGTLAVNREALAQAVRVSKHPSMPVMTGFPSDNQRMEAYNAERDRVATAPGFRPLIDDGQAGSDALIEFRAGRLDKDSWLRAAMYHIRDNWDGRAVFKPSDSVNPYRDQREQALLVAAYAHVYGVEVTLPRELQPTASERVHQLPQLVSAVRSLYADAIPNRLGDAERLRRARFDNAAPQPTAAE